MKIPPRFVLASDCFDFAWKRRKFGMAMGGQDADDRDDDHQLDQGEAFLPFLPLSMLNMVFFSSSGVVSQIG